MSLNSLLVVLPPPPNPVEVPSDNDWNAVERKLGKLPTDYRAFVQCFGTGTINSFIWVLNPLSKNPYLNLVLQMEPILGALKELREGGERCPYPLHPEPGVYSCGMFRGVSGWIVRGGTGQMS